MSLDDVVSDIENVVSQWHPRDILRRTNWLYRVDALRPRDVRDMNVLMDLVTLCQTHAQQFVIWGYSLRFASRRPNSNVRSSRYKKISLLVLQMAQLFLSEGYCFFLEYLQIAYYPSSNRINRSSLGNRFPPKQRESLSDLGENECRSMTGLSLSQLYLLREHLRIPESMCDHRSQRWFNGEAGFLHYMTYNRLGITKLQLSLYHFGGDPRRFTYTIRTVAKYLYTTFYHKISGQSLRQWIPFVHEYRRAIWGKNLLEEH